MIAAGKLIYSDVVPKVKSYEYCHFPGKINFLAAENINAKIWLLLMQEYLASEIVSHFLMHGTSVSEIVKHLITVLKKKDADLATIFVEALKKVRLGCISDVHGYCLYMHGR